MAEKYTGDLRYRLEGDREKAQALLNQARVFMGVLLESMSFTGLKYLSRRWEDAAGNVIVCQSNQTGLQPINDALIYARSSSGGEDVLRGFIVRLTKDSEYGYAWLYVAPLKQDKAMQERGLTDTGYTWNVELASGGPLGWNILSTGDYVMPQAADGDYRVFQREAYEQAVYGADYEFDGDYDQAYAFAGTVDVAYSFTSATFRRSSSGYPVMSAPVDGMLNENGEWEIRETTLTLNLFGTEIVYTQKYAHFIGETNDGQYWHTDLGQSYVDAYFQEYNKYLAAGYYTIPPGYASISVADIAAQYPVSYLYGYMMPAETSQRIEPLVRYVRGNYAYQDGAVVYLDSYQETDLSKQYAFATVLPGEQVYKPSDAARQPAEDYFAEHPVYVNRLFEKADAPKFTYLNTNGADAGQALCFPVQDSAYFDTVLSAIYTPTYPQQWTMDSGNVDGVYEVWAETAVADATVEVDFLFFGTQAPRTQKFDLVCDQAYTDAWGYTYYKSKKIRLTVGQFKPYKNGDPNPHIKIVKNDAQNNSQLPFGD